MPKVLVTGGTGVLGRELVPVLARAGADVRVLTRRPYSVSEAETVSGDIETGVGLADAVRGVDAIVHCATNNRNWDADVSGTGNLLDAAKAANKPHFVYISIVGVDRIPFGYYRAKLASETLVRDSGLPWTLQRATQFHDLVLQYLALAGRPPLMIVPKDMSVQPVETRDVAERLSALTLGEPAGRAPDFGGPQVSSLESLARSYLDAAQLERRILSVPIPGRTARGFRAGWHLLRDGQTGARTFEDFLRERVRPGERVPLTYYRKRK